MTAQPYKTPFATAMRASKGRITEKELTPAVKYRGYNIAPDSYWPNAFHFTHQDFDGAPDARDNRYGRNIKTIEAAKAAIDEQINSGLRYKADHQGDYIELTVYSEGGWIRNKYTIENEGDPFSAWCIENNHAHEEAEKEFDPDDVSGYSTSISYDTRDCREDADLVLAYCLEVIKNDFPQ